MDVEKPIVTDNFSGRNNGRKCRNKHDCLIFEVQFATCSDVPSVYTKGMVIILYSIMLNEKSFMLLMRHCGEKPFRSQITRGTEPQAVFYPLWRST